MDRGFRVRVSAGSGSSRPRIEGLGPRCCGMRDSGVLAIMIDGFGGGAGAFFLLAMHVLLWQRRIKHLPGRCAAAPYCVSAGAM